MFEINRLNRILNRKISMIAFVVMLILNIQVIAQTEKKTEKLFEEAKTEYT